MKVGSVIHTLHTSDWDRVNAKDWSRGPTIPDSVLLQQTLELGELAEPLGFDVLWSTNHLGTPYGMVPNVIQWLTYWAGRTEKIDLGSLVVILPWYNPVMLAHEIAMLDQLLKGRRFKFGVGRGISPDEYAELGVPQSESRERFAETLDILTLALTKPRFSYEGTIFKVPEMSVRPGPLHDDLMEDVLCGFNTPESMNLAAERGLGQLFIPAAPIDEMRARVISYNDIRAKRGLAPDQPTNYLWCYCVEKEEDAFKGVTYFRRFKDETSHHYGFANSEKFAKIKGYEAYADTGKTLGWGGWDRENPFEDPYLANQAIGTPDQILERVERLQKATGVKEVVVTWNYGGMPQEESLTSMKLFAKEVLPVLQKMETPLMDPNWQSEGAPAVENKTGALAAELGP